MPATVSCHLHEPLAGGILERLASEDYGTKLKALKEIKNSIIGNKTKKTSYLNLGAIPAISSVLSATLSEINHESNSELTIARKDMDEIVIQSAASLGSFACGFEDGARGVVDAGSLPSLFSLVSTDNQKVVDAGARALRMVYQSHRVPKFDFLQQNNIDLLLSMLDSENENVFGLATVIIRHSCNTSADQLALCNAGILNKLFNLLDSSPSQRKACLDSLPSVLKNNVEVVSKFAGNAGGSALVHLLEMVNDKQPKTRLLACICLILIRNASPSHAQYMRYTSKLVYILDELLEESGEVGDEAPFVFCSLINENGDLHKLAYEANTINKLCGQLQEDDINSKRREGILLAIAELCSNSDGQRSIFLSSQGLDVLSTTLSWDKMELLIAACTCLKNVSRSIKNLCGGHLMKEPLVVPLVKLLDDPSSSLQVAALGAVGNILVDYLKQNSLFVQCGGIQKLVQLSKSVDPAVASYALRALRNMLFMADDHHKEVIFSELTAPRLASFILDSAPCVQEQALAILRNLVNGSLGTIEYFFANRNILVDAIGKLLSSVSRCEILLQALYVLVNVASGSEFHKEAVMHQLLFQIGTSDYTLMMKFLRDIDSRLRVAALWVIVNLTHPYCSGSKERILTLENEGIMCQIRNMLNDQHADVKVRARMVINHCATHETNLIAYN